MITADEARQLATKANEKLNDPLDILNMIELAARKGKNGISYDGVPSPGKLAKLRQLGFTVRTEHDWRDGDYCEISW